MIGPGLCRTSPKRSSKKFGRVLCALTHIQSPQTQVCCIHRVAQLTPREGAGSLPALLLDQGQLPLQPPPCLCMGGRKETQPCSSVGEATTTSVGSRS